jgi:hypothetical protein
MHIHMTPPSSPAYDEASSAYGWENGVGITIVEKYCTLSGMLE